ncbi:MAG: MFS transporter [Eggerthellaceae bacterium]
MPISNPIQNQGDESVQKPKGSFHYAFAIVASCIAITCVPCALTLSCAGIFFTPVSEYFGVPKAQFTLYFSVLNLAMMVMLPIAGKLMNKIDLRILLSAAVIVNGVTYLVMSQLTEVWMFYVAGVFLGIGTAPLIYLAIPTLINNWCTKKVGFFVGLCMAFTGIGGVIFNPVGTALIGSGPDGWRLGYLVFGIIMLVATLPFTLLVVRSKPEDKGLLPYGAEVGDTEEASAEPAATTGVSAASAITGVSAKNAMGTLAFALVAAFAFLITMNQMVYQFLPSYCQSFEGTDIALMAGAVASACMAGQAIGKVVLGVVNDRSTKGGLFLGVGLGIVGVVAMMLVPQVIVLMVGAFLFGFVYACTTVQVPLLTRTVFGSKEYTQIYSRISTVGVLGGVVAPTFWGIIVDLPNGFTLMFVLSFVVMVASLALGLLALRQVKNLQRYVE